MSDLSFQGNLYFLVWGKTTKRGEEFGIQFGGGGEV
jgi:hypothetical protein